MIRKALQCVLLNFLKTFINTIIQISRKLLLRGYGNVGKGRVVAAKISQGKNHLPSLRLRMKGGWKGDARLARGKLQHEAERKNVTSSSGYPDTPDFQNSWFVSEIQQDARLFP